MTSPAAGSVPSSPSATGGVVSLASEELERRGVLQLGDEVEARGRHEGDEGKRKGDEEEEDGLRKAKEGVQRDEEEEEGGGVEVVVVESLQGRTKKGKGKVKGKEGGEGEEGRGGGSGAGEARRGAKEAGGADEEEEGDDGEEGSDGEEGEEGSDGDGDGAGWRPLLDAQDSDRSGKSGSDGVGHGERDGGKVSNKERSGDDRKKDSGTRKQRGKESDGSEEEENESLDDEADGDGNDRGDKPGKETLRFVCVSDTHTLHDKIDLAAGDVLIHCGDFTTRGPVEQVRGFDRWLASLDFKHKIVIAGNHEMALDPLRDSPEKIQELLPHCTYLQDSSTTIEGLKIYGTPWISRQRLFLSPKTRWAFTGIGSMGLGFALPSGGDAIAAKWRSIPEDVDILVTHMPPSGILDSFAHKKMGCLFLRDQVLNRVRPRAHIFGHIHDAHGVAVEEDITFINAANYKECYRSCVVFDFNLLNHTVQVIQNKTTKTESPKTNRFLSTSNSTSPQSSPSSSPPASSSAPSTSYFFERPSKTRSNPQTFPVAPGSSSRAQTETESGSPSGSSTTSSATSKSSSSRKPIAKSMDVVPLPKTKSVTQQ